MSTQTKLPTSAAQSRICGSGEMATLIRAKDWSTTPLGPIESWSETLIASVNFLLASPFTFALYWGREQTLIYNDRYRDLLHQKHPSALGNAGQQVWSEVWQVIGPPIRAAFEEGLATTESEALIPILVDGQMQDRWFSYGFHPVYEAGRIVAVGNPGQDDTAAVLARQRVLAGEAKLSQLLSATTDAIVSVDRNWVMTYLNPRAMEVYSTDRNVLGMNVWEAFPHAIYEGSPIVEHYYRAMDQRIAGEFETFYPGPLNIWIRLEVYPTPDGIVTFSRDITREKAERTLLKENEARLRLAQESARISPWEWDLETGNVVSGEGTIWTYGRPSREMTHVDQIVAYLLEEDRPRVREALAPAIAGRGDYRAEFRVVWPDGSIHWIAAWGSTSFSADGKPLKIIGVNTDTTEMHRTQAALLQSEKLAAVGKLASSIAHEINNPLEAVTNLLYLCRISEDLKNVHELLDTAEQELRRVSNIANQTLRFHRQSTQPKSVACTELFSTVLSMYEGKLRNSEITVEKRKRANKPIVIYEGDVRQVLNNLVGNAIDAMPRGGRLIVRSRNGLDWKTAARGIVLTIADTGSGIAPQQMSRIFEAFFTTKGINGSGLGLWISQEIMQRHHGRLRIRSSQDSNHHGTVAMMFLPFANSGAKITDAS